MPWLAVPYADEARRQRLQSTFRVMGVPTLVRPGAQHVHWERRCPRSAGAAHAPRPGYLLEPGPLHPCAMLSLQRLPAQVMVGPEGQLLTAHGRLAVSRDPEGKDFPWEGTSGAAE